VTEKPSYLGAFWRHPRNRVALLAAGCVAIFASIPFGWTGLALVGVVTLGLESLAALAIPGLPSFRAGVDREHHLQARTQRQTRLLAELNSGGDRKALATYRHMWSRVQTLHQTVSDSHNTLTQLDVEKLEDLMVDYLGLCAVNQSLKQRRGNDNDNDEVVHQRIAALQAQMQNPTLPEDELRQLRSALAEYTDAASRARRLAVRRSAIEATLVAMPDKVEEVYQLAISSPYSSGMDGKLEESLARLRIAEEVAAEFGDTDSLDVEARDTRYTGLASASASNPGARQAARALKSQEFVRK
jgi:hypothetical protein